MFQKSIKKTIYLLNIDNFEPQITALSYPLIYHYARKIGADVFVIKERKFPDWPVTFEKLQIYELAQKHGNDWNIYIDSDALVHPECIDFTQHLRKDTVAHNGADMAAIRWRYDRFFRRHGTHFGSCNWYTMASDWCIELWKPPDDQTPEEALDNIFPTVFEKNCGLVDREHLIDDYMLSRNIAKYGLKTETIINLTEKIGMKGSNFFHHEYTIPVEQKIINMKRVVRDWKIEGYLPEGVLTNA